MQRNGFGTLHSVDISPNVGVLVDEDERKHWNLHLLPHNDRAAAFNSLVAEIGELDLFLHDSDHSYRWQMMEYRAANKSLGKGGMLLSDDVDSSYAFIDHCAGRNAQPLLLFDFSKVFGIVRCPLAPSE